LFCLEIVHASSLLAIIALYIHVTMLVNNEEYSHEPRTK
jgi:hypothetical protein